MAHRLIEFLSVRRSGADIVVNVGAVEVRFGAVEWIGFNVTCVKISVARFNVDTMATPLVCL